MIIPIESSSKTTSETPEWGMVELNGELVMPDVEKDELELGSLKWSSDDTPIMIVGGHELKGNVVKLKKPFAILKKRKRNNDDDVDYSVVGVVTKKLLFDRYPKSIMR